jgi:site-specific DNA recombinase
LYIEDELKRSGVRIEYALERYDDSPEGGLMKHVKASVAEYERIKIAQRTRRGKRSSVEAGNVTCCGAPPYGYREATVDGKRTLVVHDEEAVVVRMMYRLYLEGNGNGKKFGCKAIAKRLTDRKIPSHSDKGNTINNKVWSEYGYWNYRAVGNMLKSPVYKGEWQYGKHTDNPITIPVPAIVSAQDWDAAQVIRKKNRRVRKYAGEYDFLFNSEVYCALCGKPMRPEMKRSPKVAYSYYRHASQASLPSSNGNRCAGHGLYPATSVDDLIWGYASEIISDPSIVADAFKEYGERLKSGDSPTRAKLEAAEKRVSNTERKLSRLLELYLDEAISKKQYTARKKPLDIQLEKHSEGLDALSQELEQSAKLEEHMESITQFTKTATAELKNSTGIDHRREAIRRLGLQVELSQDRKNRYVDAVFTSPELCGIKETLRIACALGSQTSLPPTIFRTRITLPPRRARRNTGSAS